MLTVSGKGLARRRASTSVAASSECSTHTPKPPSGQVDRLTTAAEESNADKSSTAQPEKTARRSRKRGGRSKAKDLTAELDSAAPQQQTTPITDYIALPLLFGEMRPMPDFPAAKLPVLGAVVLERAKRVEMATPGQQCPLLAVDDGVEAELEAVRRGEREANKLFGATPFVRFLGDYLKRVEKEGRPLVL